MALGTFAVRSERKSHLRTLFEGLEAVIEELLKPPVKLFGKVLVKVITRSRTSATMAVGARYWMRERGKLPSHQAYHEKTHMRLQRTLPRVQRVKTLDESW